MRIIYLNRAKLFYPSAISLVFFIFTSIPAQQNTSGTKVILSQAIQRTTTQLMSQWAVALPPELETHKFQLEMDEPDRSNLPHAPGTIGASQWPLPTTKTKKKVTYPLSPQSDGINFTGAVYRDTYSFPPDVMGDVGPTQFIVFINGRIRTFNKLSGVADGILDIDPNAFFSSIMTQPDSNQITFTSDPNVKYDRLTGKWFFTIIDVTLNNSNGALAKPNRILIAISDDKNISENTVWRFLYYQNTASFMDYPSLGVDADALYIGTNQFTLWGHFLYPNAYVFNKASLYTSTPSVMVFSDLNSNYGPYAPRGVDNPDPNNTGPYAIGYFIGVSYSYYGTLVLRKIFDPGGTPTISPNISISTELSTKAPVKVSHLGNANGDNGKLDPIDDRLFSARLRDGNLWTTQNIGVNNLGTCFGTVTRDAARWYEIQNLDTNPTVLQAGTLYDDSGYNDEDERNYWNPSIIVSGQGNVVLGCSIAGTYEFINAFVTGRLFTDPLGTMEKGPGGSSIPGYTNSTSSYNPPNNPGGPFGRRWGDYSVSCLDPDDDMTMWTIQEFCDSTDSWGVQVLQIKAPPPITPTTCIPNSIIPGIPSADIIVTGPVVNGSGFYDPGDGFPKRMAVSISGGIGLNSFKYDSSTRITLNISTVGVPLGYYDITVKNPDGQSATGIGILGVLDPIAVELSSFNAKLLNSNIVLNWKTSTEVNNYGFEVERKAQKDNWEKIGFVKGNGNSNSPKQYQYNDNNFPYGEDLDYRLKQIDNDGNYKYSKIVEVKLSSISYSLKQNYPNPFNPTTKIKYSIPESGSNVYVTLKVYDVLGNEIATLVNERQNPGSKQVEFNGSSLPSGIYFYRLQARNFVKTMKMVLTK